MRIDIHPRLLILVGTIILLIAAQSICATRDYAVEVSATVQESPPQIDFSWVADLTATEYRIFKKSIADTVWTGPIAVLGGGTTTFTDTDVAVGEAYEYSFRKTRGTIIDTVEIASGTSVTFTIYDSWGDGICCDQGLGFYDVTGCDTLYASGGSFGSYESTSFTIGSPESPCSALVVSITLDTFGAETSWQLTVDETGDTLAQGGPYSAPRFGHILAGIRYTPPEDVGTVLLLVDEPVADSLENELTRLELDMIRDGYRVRRCDVPDGTPVPTVKSLIMARCQSDPTISTLFLFGNIAVPYSGDVHGAHANHQGAWPADLYYGELDGAWTDSIVNNTSASRPANHNIPGDGKFDQTFLPSDVDLQVGRVDLSRLPAFAESEVGLLRRYLDKDHAFRTGEISLPRRGLIDDNVGVGGGTAYACTGWRNFTAMFGSPATRARSWLPTLETDGYLCAYGCGPGSYSSCGGVATTADFATLTMQTVFTMLMGSYFGDWDNSNNVLRAPLGSANYPLVCFWAGRPAWHLHHMAMGYPIGYSARITQNNHTLYMIAYGGRQIHTALMGDPTLRLHAVKPPPALSLECAEVGEIRLTWSAPGDSAVAGYHVYRSESLHGGFTRLSPALIEDTTYVDSAPVSGRNIYMVRAVKTESTASGTYLNPSPGIIDSIEAVAGVEPPGHGTLPEATFLGSSPNPFLAGTKITFHLAGPGRADLRIHDVTGRLVHVITSGPLPAGKHTLKWDGCDRDGHHVTSGIYFVSLKTGRSVISSKVVKVE
ncbi:MAG: FlgD immunoglobulin-like domain containing protein [Candidatus Eisenbacteria bacterium]